MKISDISVEVILKFKMKRIYKIKTIKFFYFLLLFQLGFFNRMKRPGYEPTYQGEIKKSPKDYNNDYYS